MEKVWKLYFPASNSKGAGQTAHLTGLFLCCAHTTTSGFLLMRPIEITIVVSVNMELVKFLPELFVLKLYILVNNFSVMTVWVFLG